MMAANKNQSTRMRLSHDRQQPCQLNYNIITNQALTPPPSTIKSVFTTTARQIQQPQKLTALEMRSSSLGRNPCEDLGRGSYQENLTFMPHSFINSSYEKGDIISHAARPSFLPEYHKLIKISNLNLRRKSPVSRFLDVIQPTAPHEHPDYRRKLERNPALHHKRVTIAAQPYKIVPKDPQPSNPFKV